MLIKYRAPAEKFPGNPYESRYVPGEGPDDARVMLIGEGPGEEENRLGRPFIGKSGELLDRLLLQSGLNRDDIYVTNLVKYHVPGNADPTAEDINRDGNELAIEIEAIQPDYIGLLGHHAARIFLGKGINLEWAHGLCFHRAKQADLMPMYHPAFGLHAPAALPLVQDDIRQFSLMVKGQLEVRSHDDAYPKPHYKLLQGDKLSIIRAGEPIYVDTEGSVGHPWGLSFTQRPGKGYVILASNKKLLQQFAVHLEFCNFVVLHNALHDIPVLRAMGIEIRKFRDTMIRAYHLCTEPQGLKPLSRRHAGMVQDSYEDIIKDAQEKKCTKYFTEVLSWLDKHWAEESATFSKASKKKATKQRAKGKKAKLVLFPGGTNSAKISRKKPLSSSRS